VLSSACGLEASPHPESSLLAAFGRYASVGLLAEAQIALCCQIQALGQARQALGEA
jgi:hypothetical protein